MPQKGAIIMGMGINEARREGQPFAVDLGLTGTNSADGFDHASGNTDIRLKAFCATAIEYQGISNRDVSHHHLLVSS